jgi:AraC family transcriptional activator of mtrCDE
VLRETQLDDVLDLLDVRVRAFAICEIGRRYSLRCTPHDDVVLHFVLDGHGMMECAFGRYELGPGTLVLVPRHMSKSLAGLGPIEHIRDAEPACSVSEDLTSFRAADGHADLLLGCAVLETAVSGVPLLREVAVPIVARTSDPATQGLFATMLCEIRQPRAGTRAFLSTLMKQLLILATRSLEGSGTAFFRAPAGNPQLHRAAMAILRKPGAPHSVRSLASEAAMSRARFSQRFSEAYGSSPMVFVHSARLGAAAEMLRTSELPIKAIAGAVGFASRSQFSTAFRKRYNADPSTFRRKLRAE